MDVYAWAEILWDALRLEIPPQQAELILGFGSYNEEVPRRAAELYHAGYAPRLLFTGGLGKGTLGRWAEPEAIRYRNIALACGVPAAAILAEDRATHTGENIAFTRALLAAEGISVRRAIVVHKPYMTRRIHASLQKQWPALAVTVTSPPCTLRSYLAARAREDVAEEESLHSLVGDFQRMTLYAKWGYQAPVQLPGEAFEAYRRLCALGYDRYVMPES